MNNTLSKGFLFFCLLNVSVFCCQSITEKSDLKQYYMWFDSFFEQGNSELYNGFNYFDFYRTKNRNHQFFKSNNFELGSLNYNGQNFYDIYMKYDIYKDNLVLRLPSQLNYVTVKLIKEKVYYFSIGNQVFTNIPENLNDNIETSLKGFYEVLKRTTSISLYKKHLKLEQTYISESKTYSKFNGKIFYLIHYKNSYHLINSYKDFTRLLPNYKRQISKYYKKQKKLYKFNKDDFYSNLVTEVSVLIEKNNKTN